MTQPENPPPEKPGAVQAIIVTREVANSDSAYIVNWLVPDGTLVEVGTEICVIETSKSTITIGSESRGFVRHRATAGEDIPVGGILGYITKEAGTPIPMLPGKDSKSRTGEAMLSAKAQKMIESLGLDLAIFSGRGFVKEHDVLEMAAILQTGDREVSDPRGASRVELLGPIQRRVAQMMEESSFGIPAAYLECEVDLGRVCECARKISQAARVLVSPVDLLVCAAALCCTRFPIFNGSFAGDGTVRIFDQVNVGVAVDVETDLYVVVVKNAATKAIAEISKELRALEYLAQRRRLSPDHLTGGTITVTSMIGRNIHRFRPLLYPRQAGIVGIAAPKPDSPWASMTLGFDHRLANGSQAAAFLAMVSETLVAADQTSS